VLKSEEMGLIKEGVLVREIEVRKGDTLSGISRRFSGRGSYFPQILLFNEIRNPNLIYSGATLKVPVTRSETAAIRTAAAKEVTSPHRRTKAPPAAQPPEETSPDDLKPASNDKSDQRSKTGRKLARHKKSSPDSADNDHHNERLSVTTKAGRKLFNRALRSYRRDDCSTALALFDRFLSENPSSPLAADASLYKADCYLKLSTK
jgi:TolA-binding protein